MSNETAEEQIAPATPAAASRDSRAAGAGQVVLRLAERFGLLGLLVIVVILFSIGAPETFPTSANFRIVTASIAVLAIMGMALLFPLICGRFDVSVGANVALTSVAAAAVMGKHGQSLLVAVLVALVVGTLVGVVNGSIVSYLGVNSIISTIGTATVIAGLLQWYTSGLPIFNGLSPTLTKLSIQAFAGVPALFLISLVVCLVCWYVLTQMPFGRYLAAVGSNINAAQLNGVKVRRTVLLSFVASGLVSGAGGVLQVAAQGSGDPSVGSLGFLLPALAAVFLGATTIQPGRYNVLGTVVAIVFIATVESGLILMGLEPWVSDVFNGSAVVIAIAISAQIKRRRTGTLDIGG